MISLTSHPEPVSDDSDPEFAFEADVDLVCRLNGPGRGGATESCKSPYSYSGLSDGYYIWQLFDPETGEQVTVRFTIGPESEEANPRRGSVEEDTRGAWA